MANSVFQGSADVFLKEISALQLNSNWKWEDRTFQTYLKVNIAYTISQSCQSINSIIDDTPDTRVKLSLNLFHLVILLRKGDILKCLLNMDPDYIEHWLTPVSVFFSDNYSADNLTEEDKWICMANCLHLSAKYFPEGLQIILSHFEKIHRKKWLEMEQCKTQKAKDCLEKILISRAHRNDSVSPLHVASSNPSCQ